MTESSIRPGVTSCDEQLLKGKIALVTGSSRGIGFAIAESLGKAGASIFLSALNGERLENAHKLLSGKGIKCGFQQADVRSRPDMERLVSSVGDTFGASVGILVNNAGIYRTEPVAKHDLSVWKEVLETNLTGALIASSLVIEGMISSGWGRIINISSISGISGESYGSAYSASKAGMIGLTRSLALEVARYSITVNAVCPGWVKTDMSDTQLNDSNWLRLTEQNQSESEEIARLSVPQMRFIEADEIAELAVYLASDKARGITGQAINVCGGLSLN